MRLNRLLFSRRVSVGVNVGWEFPGRRPALRPRSGERAMMCRRCMRRWRRVSLTLVAGFRVAAPAAASVWCRQALCGAVSEEPV